MIRFFLLLIVGLLGLQLVHATGEAELSKTLFERMQFLVILAPAALGDSINPCAFAVMFILLSSIFRQQQSRAKVLFAGFAFIFAIFISYIAIGIGLYETFASSSNVHYVKLAAGILGIVVGLANLKDYFFYGKYFRMEVPLSWRPKMKQLIKKITSPLGAFGIGIVISLFLLPCTSGPYITILGLLSSDTSVDQFWGYVYILIYNLIFIIPMVVICLIVAFGYQSVGELKEYKELNIEKMHLITGVIMLGLGVYILYDVIPYLYV